MSQFWKNKPKTRRILLSKNSQVLEKFLKFLKIQNGMTCRGVPAENWVRNLVDWRELAHYGYT